MRPELTDMQRAQIAMRVLEPLWPKWVQHHFQVSASTVSNWRKGRIPPEKLAAVFQELNRRMEQEEAPRPEWAEGLVTKEDLAELEARLLDRLQSRDREVLLRALEQTEQPTQVPDAPQLQIRPDEA